jgi:hypothetical protein
MVVTGWRQIASYENSFGFKQIERILTYFHSLLRAVKLMEDSYENREGEGEKGGWETGKDNFPFAFLFALPAFHYPLFPLSLFGGSVWHETIWPPSCHSLVYLGLLP